MKRYYKNVEVAPVGNDFMVALDGRPLKTPAKAPLVVPTEKLARAIAGEWRRQTETIKPAEMHFTSLAVTAIDRIGDDPAPQVEEILDYARTDLLCYRAETPEALARQQDEAWQPILDWADRVLGAPLVVTAGIVPIVQPEDSLLALRQAMADWNGWRVVAANTLTQRLGSALLALAVHHRYVSASEAFALSHIDESFQESLWGVDSEAASRRALMAAEVDDTASFLHLLDA